VRGNSNSSGIIILKNMADLKLEILVVPTYNTLTLGIADASTYPTSPAVQSPTIEITVPGFGVVSLPFNINDFNIYTSASLGITAVGESLLPLPDGVYYLRYSVTPAYINYVERTIIRVEKLQEKFDNAFMKLEMMECDLAIRRQQKVNLNSIYYFIQGSIAAANTCAVDTSNKLYIQADNMLNNFIKNNCYCTGNNYVNNNLY
tara:strand:- start:2466 stop:3077 length:612 start_codon:yes stop_codon:yes gene_type:complete